MYIGTSLDLHSPTKHPHGPTKDTINPAYHTITDMISLKNQQKKQSVIMKR